MRKTLLLLLVSLTLAASMPQLQKPEWLRRLEEQRARARDQQEAQARAAQVSEEDFDGGDEVPQHVVTRLVQDTPFRLRQGLEKFSLDSYETITRDSRKNVIYSPFSLHTALSMVYFGSPSDSETHDEMAELLGLTNEEFQNQYAVNYLQLLYRYDNLRNMFDATVEFANRIFVSDGFTPASDYKLLMQTYYLTDITPLDFSQSEATANEINRWVSQKTHGKIKDLLESSSITPLTRMMIINAIYFKANWKYKFDEKDTETLPFYVDESQDPVDHKAMKIKGQFYGSDLPDLKARVLELPYEDENFRMLVFLPDEDSSIHELDRAMASLDLKGLDRRLDEAEYEVQMPKFKADSKQDMKDVLTAMGIRTLFDNPDLSDIATPEIAGGGLRVSGVVHQAAVEVSEEGTEAAAATAVGIAIRTAKPKKKGGEFTVDRPFMFVIQDMEKGVPLFMGRIVDPTGRKRLANSRGRRESAPSIDATSNVFSERQGGERIKNSERRPEQLEIQEEDIAELSQDDLPECPEGYQTVAEPNISFPCRGRDTMVLEAAQEEREERVQRRRERAFGA